MSWSAQQYSKFEQERTRPVRDLVAAIPTTSVHRAIVLGCGPGNSTEVLVQRFPSAHISRTGNSQDMLDAARQRLPSVDFTLSDIATWAPDQSYDVILANASLQWLPDHPSLYPRLTNYLSEGGSLAIQAPDNLEEPAHRLAREVAASGPWRAKIGKVRHPERHSAEVYYALLRNTCRVVDVWRTTYFHALSGGPSAVVEWFKGTALRPFPGPLDAAEQAEFLQAYTAAIRPDLPGV
jgi:trans-aconitate 2-methyltransferase